MLHGKGNAYFFQPISYSIGKGNKYIFWEESGKLVPILFSKYGWSSSIKFPSCGVFYCTEIAWLFQSVSHSMGNCCKAHPMGENWKIDTHAFSQRLAIPSHKISNLWYSTSHEKSFSQEFLIKWENIARSVLWQEHEISMFILLPSYSSFCPIKFPSCGILHSMGGTCVFTRIFQEFLFRWTPVPWNTKRETLSSHFHQNVSLSAYNSHRMDLKELCASNF